MVDDASRRVRHGAAGDDMQDGTAIAVEPGAGKRECRPPARLQAEQLAVEGDRPVQFGSQDRDMFYPGNGHAQLLCARVNAGAARLDDRTNYRTAKECFPSSRRRRILRSRRPDLTKHLVGRGKSLMRFHRVTRSPSSSHVCPAASRVAPAKSPGDSCGFSFSLLPRAGIPGTRPKPMVVTRRAPAWEFGQVWPCRRHVLRREEAAPGGLTSRGAEQTSGDGRDCG